jgi:hypothetical protein
MRHALPLYLMVLGASSEGTILTEGAPSGDEFVRRIRGMMEPMKDVAIDVIDIVYPVPGHS